jgi:hypothetical protein
MRIASALTLLFVLRVGAQAQSPKSQPWQQIQMPTVAQAAQIFADPPSEYGPNVYYGLDNATTESIPHDLDRIKLLGFRAVTFQAGRHMVQPYLSDGYFALVQALVKEAAARDLRVWIVDDGGYPSGFAGGKFTTDAPQLRMQALTPTNSIDLTPGQEFEDVVSPTFVAAIAYNVETQASVPLPATQSHIRFNPPPGHWRVLIVDHQFRSSLTRSITNPAGTKDDSQSLENYLDPVATQKFLEFEHEQYRKFVGDQFGKTILGFRGDEPDFSFFGLPYTAGIFEEFKRRKGYDIQPSVASLFLPVLTPATARMRADYTDVWSGLFRDNFFKVQADWCAAHHLEYQVHINHEDDLPRLAVTEGDFLRDLNVVQIPGVDAIWHQIWQDNTPDFPKLASSSAHLSGHPRAFTESFASYRPTPTAVDARFILNEQIIRGINLVEVMHYPFNNKTGSLLGDPEFPKLMSSMRRTTALLSQGRPTAAIGVYVPSINLWLGEDTSNTALLSIAKQLMESQHDFDFIDDDSIAGTLHVEGQGLRTASGNVLKTILVPSGSILSAKALKQLQAIIHAGGHVVFFGQAPITTVIQNISQPAAVPAIAGATVEPLEQLTPSVLAALPPADLHLTQPASGLRYLHRSIKGGDIYLLFNEGALPIKGSALLAGDGAVEVWSPEDGTRAKVKSGSIGHKTTSISINLQPGATTLFVIE